MPGDSVASIVSSIEELGIAGIISIVCQNRKYWLMLGLRSTTDILPSGVNFDLTSSMSASSLVANCLPSIMDREASRILSQLGWLNPP
jgi:hypothetical protein